MEKQPKRCIDPVVKYCQECKWGQIIYPDWVETADDALECSFKTNCILEYDKGRLEDEPTEEEIKEFEEWVKRIRY